MSFFGLFKNVEDKIKDLGFVRTRHDPLGVEYNRGEHHIAILRKSRLDLNYILHSYNPNLVAKEGIGYACMGLSLEEIKLFEKLMEQMVTAAELEGE